MSAQSASDYPDHVSADLPDSGPSDKADTDCEERALAAWRRESAGTDVHAVVIGHYGKVVLIVASTCSPLPYEPGGKAYCMCEPLAAYRIRGDGRLRRTGTRMYIQHARDQHKSPEQRAAEEAHARAMLRLLRGGA